MSTLILAESFELHAVYSGLTFTQYLESSGVVVSGSPSPVTARDGVSTAVDLSNGALAFNVTSIASVLTFGFAAFSHDETLALTLSGETTLEIGPEVYVSGFAAPQPTPTGRWYYYELELDKASREITLYINDVAQAPFPMPNDFRFRTQFEMAFPASQGLLVDDIGVTENGRTGPIAARAFDTSRGLPRDIAARGQQVDASLPDGDLLPEDPVAVQSSALLTVTDLDARRVVAYSGSDEQPLTIGLTPTLNVRTFSQAPDAGPWTQSKITNTAFGVRITE